MSVGREERYFLVSNLIFIVLIHGSHTFIKAKFKNFQEFFPGYPTDFHDTFKQQNPVKLVYCMLIEVNKILFTLNNKIKTFSKQNLCKSDLSNTAKDHAQVVCNNCPQPTRVCGNSSSWGKMLNCSIISSPPLPQCVECARVLTTRSLP